ncbi:MAG: hypothetical protein HY232_11245 [Acidobacteria bacterium]|nr:hypothetical protein [Acidobacteriota bacterium]
MKVFSFLILILAAVGSAGAQPAFRADVKNCVPRPICQTAGGPNVREAAISRINSIAFDRHAIASAINQHTEAYLDYAPGPSSVSAGFWDTVTVTDPKHPLGEPLDLVVVAHASGSVSESYGNGRASAGLRTDGIVPDGPLDGSTYQIADSDIYLRIVGRGYDEIQYSDVITISNGDTVAFYSNVVAGANHSRGGAQVHLDSWIESAGGKDLLLDWASQQ